MASLGQPLTEADYRKLETESWITPALADAAKLVRVTSQEGADIIGRKNNRDYAGIVFPYIEPETGRILCYRLRRDHPEHERRADGTLKEIDKYLSAPGDRNRLYYPPGVSGDMLLNVQLPIIVTEGEKKGLSLWRLANHEVDKPRFLPIGLSGVSNWRGTIDREPGPDGKLYTVKGPIRDLEQITWKGREIFILFDSETSRRPDLRSARRKLAIELEGRN